MREVLLIKLGELVLKGLNRIRFEECLISHIERRIKRHGNFEVYTMQSTIYIEPLDENADILGAESEIPCIFGIVAYARAVSCEKDFDKICAAAAEYSKDELMSAGTFRVEAKRSDKSFPMTSPEISRELGAYLISQYPHLKVNLREPEALVSVEIRDRFAYVHPKSKKGAGGLPVGMNGRAALLLSGGIDSPVSGYMMARRGAKLSAVHFFSYPYTSERAKLKVIELTRILTAYAGVIELFVVPFTRIQEEIRKKCPEELFTLIMRRFMMRIAQEIAIKNGCGALITGESLGQVASQTMDALNVTGAVLYDAGFSPGDRHGQRGYCENLPRNQNI